MPSSDGSLPGLIAIQTWPDDEHAGDEHRRVVQRDRARQAQVVLRSPSHSSMPETVNSTRQRGLDDRVRFWPALKRPCGTPPAARRSQQQVVGVEALELAPRAPQRAPVAEDRDERERRQPRDGGRRGGSPSSSGRLGTICASTGR